MKLGSAFSDNVVASDNALHRRDHSQTPWWAGAGRMLLLLSVLCISFFVLAWRLFDLTVVHGLEYRKLSDNNRIRSLIRHAPRGNLLDRTGKPLTQNISQYRLLKPCATPDQSDCVTYLSQEEGEKLSAQGLGEGEYLELDYHRQYTLGETVSHVIGYTGELSADELTRDYYALRGHIPGDRVGRMGAEAVFNEQLRGRDGKQLVEVDVQGKILRELGRQEAIPGEDITLSLDANIAKAVAQAYPAGQNGAVVVSKPATGEILALFSSPGFSPNAFSTGMSTKDYELLVDNPDLPMFNRAIGGVYPPGSTFKLVTALAGLETGAITKSTIVEDNGTITIGPFSFSNWYFNQYGKTEGPVNLEKALARSNDIYFYKAGEWIGITNLVAWAQKVGIGKPLGIELAGEASGLMPDPNWKKTRFASEADIAARNDEWYLGDTYHVSIGQGYLLTTPLQVNFWTNIVANGGKLCTPTIEKKSTHTCVDVGIKKESLDAIVAGMVKACETGGTAWPLFDFAVSGEASDSAKVKIPIACKTGTAEFGHPKDHTHAWFTVFAPVVDPEISITVLVEEGGEGSTDAAPIAKKILEEWFMR